jgi:osmotically-inducible protein OsmY
MTGPSAIGSENGTPSSITSAPASTIARITGTVTDVELERLMHEAIQQELWTSRHRVTVNALRGTIRLTGVVAGPAERSALIAMARTLPGCSGVEDRLVVLRGAGRRQPVPVV